MLARHRLTILLAFTFSGCTGLIYESVWSHYLGLYLGHAAYAQTLTLGIFMGGMTLGAFLISRHIGRIKNALMGYALAELVLGLAGLIFHVTYSGLVGFSYDTAFPGLGDTGFIGVYKWTSGALLILPQSIVLGATFPLLCSALIRREQEGVGKHISILYFTNSIGAAAGALLATFLLIPNIGMPGAMMTSGMLNIAIAIVTYFISKHPEPAGDKADTSQQGVLSQLTLVALIAAAITGAVSFMYEIAWIRMLNLVLGTTLHAFEIMLSAFIAGIALGGLWIRSRIDRIPDLLRFTGLVQIFMGMAAIATLSLYNQSFTWVAALLNETLQRTDTGYFFYNFATSLISGLIMIPATFCAGMTLPLLTTHLIRNGHNENAIGRVYASNTIGAIVGIVLAVHLGLTILGLKWLIIVAGIIDVGLGIYLIFYTGRSLRDVSIRYRIAALAMAGLVSLSFITELSPSRLASGTFRYGRTDSVNEILFYRDGKTASISVEMHGEDHASIATNGKPDAGLKIIFDPAKPDPVSDETTMGMLGSLALLVDPNLKEVANIGFGSGLTSHILLSSPAIETLDTIEVEPVMVEGARLFNSRNHLAYEDYRSLIHFDDAKTFFASRQKKYDAIVSEPSNPWVMGVGNLFSIEFYDHIKRYLQDDGLLVQWLHLYEISLPTLLTALKSLNQSFGNYEIYAANYGDIVIVATPDPTTDISIRTNWNELPEGLRHELKLVGMDNMNAVLSRKLTSKSEIEALISAKGVAHNSDYFPLLSLNAPRDRFKEAKSQEIFGLPTLGINDNPYRNRILGSSDFTPDEHHPYVNDVKMARQFEDILLHDKPATELNFNNRGILRTVMNPRVHCDTPIGRDSWVSAYHYMAANANDYGSQAMRDKLVSYAALFTCTHELEKGQAALFRTVTISLGKFSATSSTEIRRNLVDLQDSSLHPKYVSFVISSYLSSLIIQAAPILQEDLQTIANIRGGFDTDNLWLEALLLKKITS